jgi:lipopolysaccharide/colanic/teichoic acid biosynthesis glycosyltransferase
MKRLFDITVAGLALLLLSPVILLTAFLAAVKLGRPVLFRQRRPGMNGEVFELLKFRTMTDARDKSGNLLPDAERLSPFGVALRRASLDELPSLLNVLRGDMSLVGPRPLLVEYLPLYTQEQAGRHAVKPGITGWAQINGRNAISWEQKFEYDVWYVKNASFCLDMRILMLTVKKVLVREGISAAGEATMGRFLGSRKGNHTMPRIDGLQAGEPK